ncbi:hypothetical protein J3R83DRAFT_9548 [Lanmaoa asiatica]|nr:hypothetical protein J3R83DRAFT_9548 [Lanmaoa asiatica]
MDRPDSPCLTNFFPAACARCGATEPGNVWNICRSCVVEGSRPGAMTSAGPSTAKQHPPANCTSCRVSFRVPSQCQTAHVLCPPCEVRRAAISKPKPRNRVPLRANPYPVVLPMHALALTLAFTYPHLPVPSSTSAPLHGVGTVTGGSVYASVNYGENVPRVCLRFGCGARLPVHVLGDMCEACTGAGFVRPPPAILQKRVPRRATERVCPRPRESLDLVRASLAQEAARGAKVTENELEADLVYPDDIPVATNYALTPSESKREELKPIEDENVELELLYPEDAEKATRTSSSKPRTKLFPPPTLCELFKDSLQTIPASQDLTALADKSPPVSDRNCHMPGCKEILPAQTRMQRCIKCSIGDWKRRKLAAMDIPDLSWRPNATSLTTDTSMEEKEVMTTLSEISEVEDGSDLPPPPSSSPSKGGGGEVTGDHDGRLIPGWDGDLTELSYSNSDTESTSDSGPVPDPRPSRPRGDATGLRIRIPMLVTRLPPGSLLQKCGNKRCNVALPKVHRWKTCDSCRRAQRMRSENKRRRMMGIEGLKSPDLSYRRWRSLSPDITLTPNNSRPCSVKHCRTRVPLPEIYRWKICIRCRARARRETRRKRDALLETQNVPCQPEVVPRFQAYQNRGALLSSFDSQLKEFIEGQIVYLRAKLSDSEGRDRDRGESELWKLENSPMMFVFVGEYSIVTGQRDDGGGDNHDRDHSRRSDNPAELEAMRREVSSIVMDLECILHAKFRAGEAFAIDKGGIIMRFTCSLELIAQLRPLAITVDPDTGPSSAPDSEAHASKDQDTSREDPPSMLKQSPNPPPVPLVKTLSGELEAVVVPDESHRLFHGRRTVIRYHMIG